jgi:hypothetical protein
VSKLTDQPAEGVILSLGKVESDYRRTNPDGSLSNESFKWNVTAV